MASSPQYYSTMKHEDVTRLFNTGSHLLIHSCQTTHNMNLGLSATIIPKSQAPPQIILSSLNLKLHLQAHGSRLFKFRPGSDPDAVCSVLRT
jgi:hypothetical protein